MKAGGIAGLIAAAVLAAGCGGGDAGEPPAGAPKAVETLDEATERIAAGIASSDCKKQVDAVLPLSKLTVGDLHEPSQETCHTAAQLARRAPGWRPTASKRFGTAAAVDADVRGTNSHAVLILDLDGRWRPAVLAGVRAKHQIGTKPPAKISAAFDRNAKALVRGLHDRDCKAVYRAFSPGAPYVAALPTLAKFCDALATDYRGGGTGVPTLAQSVAADSDPEPVPLGRTFDQAFYALALDDGSYYTLVTSQVPVNLIARYPGHPDGGVLDLYLARQAAGR